MNCSINASLLCIFCVKKDAVFSLGIRYGCELSEWARDSGALKGYVVLSLAHLFAWAGLESRARDRERRCRVPLCRAWLGHKSSELIPISFRQAAALSSLQPKLMLLTCKHQKDGSDSD